MIFILIGTSNAQVSQEGLPGPAPGLWTESTSSFERQMAAQESIAFSTKEKWSTNAVLIIKNKTIVFERYDNGFELDTPQRLWSISKSISSALIGMRWKELNLGLNDPISTYYPQLKDNSPKPISIKNLLHMSSGIDWNEGYESNPLKSDVVRILYSDKRADMATYKASLPSRSLPGQRFYYSSGETNLLMGALSKTFQDPKEHEVYPWAKLFNPLGMTDVTWERDGSGTFIGSSYIFMKARDLARFSLLYLQKGLWKEKEILDKDYIRDSLIPGPASCLTHQKSETQFFSYGHHWWLNKKCSTKERSAFVKLPGSTFLALGHHGQTLAIFPELGAIVIRFGADKDGNFDRELWLNEVFNSLKEIKVEI